MRAGKREHETEVPGFFSPDKLLATASQEPLLEAKTIGNYFDSFVKNIFAFLDNNAELIKLPKGDLCWTLPLRYGVRLTVYQEKVDKRNYCCDQCRIIGACVCD